MGVYVEESQISNPQVSVIMPVYNSEKTIRYSIASVYAQSFKEWELIVINDCSNDKSCQVIKDMEATQSRIRLLSNESNKGVAYSRNKGIAVSRGTWLAFLDSDDLWRDDKLEKQVRLMKERDAVISYTGTAYMDYDGREYSYKLKAKQKLPYNDLLKHNIMSCSSVMVRRDIMERISFASGCLHEDYAAWLSIVNEAGHAYGLNEPLVVYRLSKESKSGKRFNSALMTYKAYRYVKFNPLTSFALTLRYAKYSITKRLSIRIGGFSLQGTNI